VKRVERKYAMRYRSRDTFVIKKFYIKDGSAPRERKRATTPASATVALAKPTISAPPTAGITIQ